MPVAARGDAVADRRMTGKLSVLSPTVFPEGCVNDRSLFTSLGTNESTTTPQRAGENPEGSER